MLGNDLLGRGNQTVTLTATPETQAEGGAVQFTAATTGLAIGTAITLQLSGVDASDITGDLTRTATVGAGGTATFTVNIAKDSVQEQAENLTATLLLNGQSVATKQVTISADPPPFLMTDDKDFANSQQSWTGDPGNQQPFRFTAASDTVIAAASTNLVVRL